MKKFNKIITILAFTLSSVVFAQNSFEKFENIDDVSTVIVNKKMFEMMGNVKTSDKDAEKFKQLIKNLDHLKVYSTKNKKWATELKNTSTSYLKNKSLEELMRANDKGENVKIYVNQDQATKKVKELLMLIDNANGETVVLSLIGNFNLNDVSMLSDKIPGGNQLKNISK